MSQRPEDFDDLHSWDRYEELATIRVSDVLAKNGVFRAIDVTIGAYLAVHGALIQVVFEPNRVEIRRPYTEAELTEKLLEAQKSWDYRQKLTTAKAVS